MSVRSPFFLGGEGGGRGARQAFSNGGLLLLSLLLPRKDRHAGFFFCTRHVHVAMPKLGRRGGLSRLRMHTSFLL